MIRRSSPGRTSRHDPVRLGGRARGLLPSGMLAVMLALTAVAGWPGAAAAADRPTLKVDPPTQTVGRGQTFVVNVVQSAATETTGAQVDVVFDPQMLQLKSFELGPAYTSANAVFQFGVSSMGSAGNVDVMLARANKWGSLQNLAGFLLPGSGTIQAGDAVFLKFTFVAKTDAAGPVTIGLLNASMIDAHGGALDPRLVNGSVVVSQNGVGAGVPSSPGPSAQPSTSGAAGATSEPSSSPQEALTGPAPSPSSPTTPVKVSVAPTSLTLKVGNTARVFLIADADGNLSSVTADLTFDKDKLEVIGLEAGPAWSAATVIAVATGSSRGLAGAIADANTTGVLQQAGAFFSPGTRDLPYGERVFVSVLVKAKVDGTSNLSVGNATALGVASETIPVAIGASSLSKPPDKGLQLDPTLVIPLIVLAVLAFTALVIFRSGRVPVRVRRRWPYYVSLALGMVPVALFVVIVVAMVVSAAPVVANPGLGALFGGQFLDAKGNLVTGYNILPALWGTFLVTLIAAAVGLPISLVMAVVAVDFPMGPIGRFVRPLVGILSGVPPIVYAVSVPVFVTALMIPKFTGNFTSDQFNANLPAAVAAIGANASSWPPAGIPHGTGSLPLVPWNSDGPNSTLMAGLLVGLFLIPFATPIFVDALRNVPRAAREGSLALGANQTYTLRRVVLPRAIPAIAGGSTFAVLKAMGDSVIVIFAVGYAGILPSPPFDVLERAAPVGAWGANLIGSFDTLSASCSPQSCAVGYASTLSLLVAACVVVLLMTYLRARGRRRVAT